MRRVLLAAAGLGCLMMLQGCEREQTMEQRLSKAGPERDKAVEAVLEHPGRYPCTVLFTAAGAALSAKRLEDSAFLFYAGQMRARFDRECFPPKGNGGDNPFVAVAALSNTLGATINPQVMAEPKAFAGAMSRLKGWTPEVPEGYQPGYEYLTKKSVSETLQTVGPKQAEILSHMTDMATLLNDPEYFAAFRTFQAYSMGPPDKRPTEGEKDKAMAAMLKIEGEKGVKGFASMMGR